MRNLFHVAFTIPTGLTLAGQMQVMVFIHPTVIYGAEFTPPSNFDVLLGMDVLSNGSLKIEGSDGAPARAILRLVNCQQNTVRVAYDPQNLC